ncbi:MAG TPA: peptidoglycan DD-metalloendopeptidase family protein [Candidatus Dormibacteraeota bacterium]|jgi:murein DD-endopeptidase MepM/ murein hydrolase activator NlpD|nr:peptidoglycan DD-metalloendopeptidase family protein [Candidatus Dormibacteraeota bacterium]
MRKSIFVLLAFGLLNPLLAQAAPVPTPTPCPSVAPQGSLCAAENEKQAIDQIRARLGNDLAQALVVQQDLAQSLASNDTQLRALKVRLDTTTRQESDLQAQIDGLSLKIDQSQARLAAERAQIALLARAGYRQPDSLLVVMAQSPNLADSLTQLDDLMAAGSRGRTLESQMQSDLAQLGSQKSNLDQAKAALATNQTALERGSAQLIDLQNQQQATLAQLVTKIQATKTQLDAASSQSAALAAQITMLLEQQETQIIATAMEQVWEQVEVMVQSGANGAAHGDAPQGFAWPETAPVLTQGFGPSTLALEPPYQQFPHFHTGIDLAEPVGSPVLASAAGAVMVVGNDPFGYGNYLVIAHAGGLVSLYGHLQQTLVSQGQTVAQNQVVGLEGSSGNSTGPHLHFEIRSGSTPLDPLLYLPARPTSNG